MCYMFVWYRKMIQMNSNIRKFLKLHWFIVYLKCCLLKKTWSSYSKFTVLLNKFSNTSFRGSNCCVREIRCIFNWMKPRKKLITLCLLDPFKAVDDSFVTSILIARDLRFTVCLYISITFVHIYIYNSLVRQEFENLINRASHLKRSRIVLNKVS